MMKNRDFVAFILSHGRPDNVLTYQTLLRHGYTGRIVIVIDNEDVRAEEYYERFGRGNVVMFDKEYLASTFDECDNFKNRKAIVYARNACFGIAKALGYKYFIELDDDYYYFGTRGLDGGKHTERLDDIFDAMVDFVRDTPVKSVAMGQGGDYIGGYDGKKKWKRKAMNSFVCSVDKPFSFIGRINEDVNTYVHNGSIGDIFITALEAQLDQKDTQSNKGGMTDIYIDNGTYVKSFYSVIVAPSCVKLRVMGESSRRIHHSISWRNAVPCIISEKWKKKGH